MNHLAPRLIALSVILYALMCGYLYLFQRDIMYHPTKHYSAPPEFLAGDVSDVTYDTGDGIALTSWFHAAQPDERMVVYLHGNSGNLADEAQAYRQIIDAGYGLLAVEWRGFGGNAGTPTEDGLYEDAHGALAFLKLYGVPSSRIHIIGRSLGSGVAVQMATEYELASISLISPYSAVSDVAAERYWYAPVSLLLKDRYDSISKMEHVEERVFIYHGSDDRVIPVHHARSLARAAGSEADMTLYDGLTHDNIPLPDVLYQLKQLDAQPTQPMTPPAL